MTGAKKLAIAQPLGKVDGVARSQQIERAIAIQVAHDQVGDATIAAADPDSGTKSAVAIAFEELQVVISAIDAVCKQIDFAVAVQVAGVGRSSGLLELSIESIGVRVNVKKGVLSMFGSVGNG